VADSDEFAHDPELHDALSEPADAEPRSRDSRVRKRLIIAGIALVALVGLYAATSLYTSRSAFCNSCHEMTPYYTAWQAGPHAEVACIKCHVDPGVLADFAHKFVALREVWVHFTGDPTFPMPTIELPNERCLHCHDGEIDPGIADFDHEEHRNGRTCKTCHDTSGHAVTAAALEAAGILNADVQAQRAARRGIVVGNGTPQPGHVSVGCSKCHDMPASLCAACHEPPRRHYERPCLTCHTPDTWEFVHPDAAATCVLCHDRPAGHRDGECSLCHVRGSSWDFVHPASPECGACHTPPRDHYAGSCAACHAPGVPFASAVFTHPGQDASCPDCHSRPSGHSAGGCASCHRAGASWAFVHPTSTACAGCHRPPGNHYSGACSACHSPGRPFASAVFTHPGQSAPCADCHARPGGHPGGQCSGCHGVGGGWAFVHPVSSACANCHAAPANHYGPTCASCHSPSRAWSSATFTHPGIQEHTYRSFPCAQCHPSGYTSVNCTCHGGNPPEDD